MTITKDTIIGDILTIAPQTAPLFMNIGMHCLGCPASRGETVEQACMVHGVDPDDLLAKVNEMIAAAEKRTAAYSDQAKYVCASFSELMSKPDSFFGGKFDCVIMLGVCMYINDTELVKCLTRLVDLLNDKCVMYVGDAVGLGTRLTLDQIHSDQLDSDYSAIYRTAEEYVKLYSIFTKQGFHFAEQAYFPPEINGTRYNDSDRWYAILKR